ncbi:hypothetical protein [Burkholderia ambifaria]|uniref:hypothetical protein n=1 Tax=Burkholderia ambifaria TaxID=152480 RepID=UPI00158AA211|nr:hypothetical protein [Burkholderia ambifaria]MBR8345235.1 hypothetical protein [Burkholderia ambifaria]
MRNGSIGGSIAAIFPGNIETSAGFLASAWCMYRPEYRPSRPKIAQVESTHENRDLRKNIHYRGIYWGAISPITGSGRHASRITP